MSMPYVPGWGDVLNNALPQLGQGISKIMGVNLDQQNALKSAMIKDPSILMKYASVERDNPGILASMGFGKKFGEVVGSIGESEDEKLEKQKKQADIARTQAETTESGARTTELGSQSDLAKAQTKLANIHLDDLARDNNAKAALFKAIPDLSNQNISKLAADYSAGKIDNPQLIARIQADPQYGPVFEGMSKNIIERAKLAIEQGKLDRLDKSEKQVALRYALSNQREAEQRLTSLQTLQRKYGSMDQQHLMAARMMAQGNPNSPAAAELAQYDQMVANGNVDIENAKKDAVTAKALTMGAFRQNPEFKNIMAQLEADNKKKEQTQTEIDSADREDPMVTSAREAIKAIGLDKVKSLPLWKSLPLSKQKAALGQSPYEDDVVTKPKAKSTSSVDRAGLDQININSPSAYGNLGMGSGVQPNSLPDLPMSGYQVMQKQMQDVIDGKPIGDYPVDPSGSPQMPSAYNPQGRLPISSPNFDTPISGIDSSTLARLGMGPTSNPGIRP